MAVHISNFQDIINQLTNLEIILPDELQACLLLGTLPDNWDTLVVALSNSAPNEKLSLATVTDSLFNEETRRKGSGISKTELGCKLLLKKVRHVPEIRLNLISTGQLDDEGYSNKFSNGRWKLSKGSLIVARGQKTDTLYRLRAKHNSGQINVVEDYPIELWHKRLGHISEKDDHSKKVWAYSMKTKDQVTEIFKNFHAAVEIETGMKQKCVRVDNGGEYRGPFENYCRTHGIKLERTVPKTPQQNGLAERMNRTIVERVVVWTSKEVSYKHLRVFGCKASVHIPRDERSKLDAKVKQYIFLGYAHEEFGYRF
ncbi:hypothetical protein CRG98_011133 [Punica granatum]|uniref:Integrase catalytic domain-containing protein n=1 Tax=Punica granatum TaxID=22663 RepID=A0A2I0KJ06_PUNGR|nr:hypothetical protein CRG98_011133 [Punica granatum]